MSQSADDHEDLEAYRADIDEVERRIAREIEVGGRALVVLIVVFVLVASFLLPHTGAVRGWDVLFAGDGAAAAAVTLPSRLFMWLALVFGVGFSLLALLTRRWAVAWMALAGSAVASAAGLLAVWSRQTVTEGYPGPGVGLVVAWICVIVLTFHWARLVWSRTVIQLAAEEQRRRAAAQRQSRSPLHDLDRPEDKQPPSD